MPIGIGLGVAGAATLGGAAIEGSAAKSAAKTTANAANQATALQQQEYNQTTAANKPFLTTGTSALNQLAGLYGLSTSDANGNVTPGTGTSQNLDPNATFYQTPDYQFDLSQGIKGVDAGAAAGGMLDSGATRKAEITYAGNLASGQFNNYASRLQQIAGLGQSAVGTQSNAGTNLANEYTNTVTNAAANEGNATLAGAGAATGAVNTLGGYATLIGALGKNPFGSSYGTPAGQSSGPAMGYT